MDPTPPKSTDPTPEAPTDSQPQAQAQPQSYVDGQPQPQPQPQNQFQSEPQPQPQTQDAPQAPATTQAVEPTAEPTPQVVPVAEPAASEVTPAQSNPGHGLGIASLVLSILGIHLVGIILGIVGLNKSKKAGHKNGLALAGIIVGSIGLVIGIMFFAVFGAAALQLVSTCAELGPGMHDVEGVMINCS